MSSCRRGGLALLVLAFVLASPAFSRAFAQAASPTPPERGDALPAPEPGVRRPFAWPTSPPVAPAPASAGPAPSPPPRASFAPPHAELVYAFYRLDDPYGNGAVHAFQFGGFLPTRALRLGLRSEIGIRRVPLVRDDLVLRGALVAGYQHLARTGRLVPYVVAIASYGVVFGKRFHTPFSRALGGGGLEAGVDLRLVTRLSVGLALAYERASFGGRGRDLFQLRLRLGL